MPNFSWTTLASGAKQFVVHDALEITVSFPVYLSSLTPITNIGASADGAVMTTFLAPAWRCGWHLSTVVNTPVDSTTYSAPRKKTIHDSSFRVTKKKHTELTPWNFGWFFPLKKQLNYNEIFKFLVSINIYSVKTAISCPLTMSFPFLCVTSPLNLPWVESYLNI